MSVSVNFLSGNFLRKILSRALLQFIYLFYFVFFLFLCQLTLWQSLWHRRLRLCEQLLQNNKAQGHAVFFSIKIPLIIPYLSRMKNCLRHADLFLPLFPRATTNEIPPPTS